MKKIIFILLLTLQCSIATAEVSGSVSTIYGDFACWGDYGGKKLSDCHIKPSDLSGTEGTFKPTIIGSTTAGVQTYLVQNGVYRVIGDMVFFTIYVHITALDAGIAGETQVGGLPVPARNTPNLYGMATIAQYAGITLDSGYTQLSGRVNPGTQYLTIRELGSGKAQAAIPVASITATTNFIISGFYFK